MTLKGIEHFDSFGDTYTFWIVVGSVDNTCEELAKTLDKENYSEDCFGICVRYDKGKVEVLSNAKDGGELYYIDNNGDKNWLPYRICEDLYTEIAKLCEKELIENENMIN